MSFEIKIGETRGVLNVCFPATSIEAVSGSFTRSWQRARREMTMTEQAALDENVGRVNVTLAASIQAAIGAGDFLRLQVGDVVGLEHPATEPIEVSVNGKAKFVGAPVVSATRSHIRIEGPVRSSRTHAA
jgi:flagellar motor switch protein FliM